MSLCIKLYNLFNRIKSERGNISYPLPLALTHSISRIARQTAHTLSAVTLAFILAYPAIANADYTSLQEAVADTTISDKTYNLGADESVGADLGTLGGTSLTINGENSGGANYGIVGNDHKGITVNSGQELTIKNVGDAEVTFDANHMLTGLTINKALQGFKKDSNDYSGGAIYNSAGLVNIEDSVFAYNTIVSRFVYGGAIYNSGAMYFSGVNTFAYNSATGTQSIDKTYGGAIYNTGSGAFIYLSGTNTFANNSATSREGSTGGAIYNSGAFIYLSGTNTFANNSATSRTGSNGGAIYNTGVVYLSGINIFDSNKSVATYGKNSNGGAIYNSGTMYISGTNTFAYNSISTNEMSGSTNGGAIYNSGTMYLSGTNTFKNNSAQMREMINYVQGGAIYNSGSMYLSGTNTFEYNKVTASDHSSYLYGGAIYNSGTMYLSGTNTFAHNSATYSQSSTKGGAIYNSGTMYLSGINTFAYNSATGSSNYGYGGAIYNSGKLYLTADTGDAVFIGNKTGSVYNDIYNNGTLNLNAAQGRKITFGGTVTGDTSGTRVINLNDDSVNKGGDYIFNNEISNNTLNLYNNAKVTLGTQLQPDGTTTSYGKLNLVGLTNDANGGSINMANSHVDANNLGVVTLSSALNMAIDLNATAKTADTLTTASTAASTGTININDLNILGEFSDWDENTTVLVLTNNHADSTLALTLADALKVERVLGTIEGGTTTDTIGTTTNWTDKFYQHVTTDETTYGNLDIITANNNYSLGMTNIHSVGGDTTHTLLGDTLALVVQATEPAERSFVAGDATADYNVTADLGTMGGTSLTIDGKNSSDTKLGIVGNNKKGITVGAGQELTVKNVGDANVTFDENHMLTGLTINSAIQGFVKNTYDESSDYSASSFGNIIYNINGVININDSVFYNNKNTAGGGGVTDGTGGAIYNGKGYTYSTSARLHLSGNNIFAYNSAQNGGAIGGIGHIDISGTNVFAYNSATSHGGAMKFGYQTGGVTRFSGTNIFAYNNARNGGAISNMRGAMYLSGTNTFAYNSASFGGAVYNYANGFIYLSGTNIFAYNSAPGTYAKGGAIVNSDGANGPATMYITADTGDTVFVGNTANGAYNDIHQQGGSSKNSVLNLNAAEDRSITFGGSITGQIYSTSRKYTSNININNDDVNKGGNYIFNNTVQGNHIAIYNGANITLGSQLQPDGETTTYGVFDLGHIYSGNSLVTTDSLGVTLKFTNDANGGSINMANGHIDANSLGRATLQSALGVAIDANLSGTPTADTFTTASGSVSTGTIRLDSVNLLGGSWAGVATDGFKLQIINNANASSTLQLAIGDALATTLAASDTNVVTPASSYDDPITATTNWNDVLYHHEISEKTETKGIGLATTTTANDSLGYIVKSTTGGVDTATVTDTLAAVVQATTPAVRSFEAGDATTDYNVTADLGTMGGTSLTIDGKNSSNNKLGIVGNNHKGITVNSGKTLTIKNVGDATVTTDANGMLTGLTINSAIQGFLKNTPDSISSSYTYTYGSTINNRGAVVNISDSVFYNNKISENDSGYGRVYIYGGVIYNSGKMYLSGANTFAYNSASGPQAYGGAIYNSGASAYMYLSGTNTFAYNSANTNIAGASGNAFGGALHNNNGTIYLFGTSTFVYNKAQILSGSSPYASGGAIYNRNGTIYLSGANTFAYNSAIGSNSKAHGGAIANYGQMYFSGTNTFAYNRAYLGGAIYNSGTMYLSGTNTFAYNSASIGGAISNSGTMYITADTGDTVFIGNKAGTAYNDIYNTSTLNLNAASGRKITFGGSITGDTSGTRIINLNNNAVNKGGDYIFNNEISNNTLNLYNNAQVTLGTQLQPDGETTTYGKFSGLVGLTNDANGGTINMANSHVDANNLGVVTLGSALGMAIDLNATAKTADTLTTASTSASTGTININSLNITGDFIGWDADTKIQILTNNHADSTLALTLDNAITSVDRTLGAITGGTTYDTITATTDWDHVYQKHVTSDGTIYGNLALATTTTANDSIGVTNVHTVGGETTDSSMGDTLALVVQATEPAERSFEAGDATADYNVTADLGTLGGTSLTIDGKNSSDNKLGIIGNNHIGIKVGEGQELTIKNVGDADVTFDENHMLTGLTVNKAMEGFRKNVTDSIVSTGIYSAPTNGYAYGSVINNQGGVANVKDSVFAYNSNAGATSGSTKTAQGGVIYNTGMMYLSGANIFAYNSATGGNSSTVHGGAIYNGGAMYLSGTNTFAYNKARSNSNSSSGAYGGAIYNNGTMYLSGTNTFVYNENSASSIASRGGAIYNSYKGPMYLSGTNTFAYNSATYSGGAIYNSGGQMYLSGTNTFTYNSASDRGGAVHNDGGFMYLSGANTFAYNSATGSGGAIYNDGGNLTITADTGDTVFIGNKKGSTYNDIHQKGYYYPSKLTTLNLNASEGHSITFGGIITGKLQFNTEIYQLY